ncbi:hypothetical protein [Dyella humicola]|uniref:hypothetical protein n=1 Tax=Dyella humicola TaxID=2992126 RepID=UPI00224FBE4C|nr:hypothetical protein [Dyella humicola]
MDEARRVEEASTISMLALVSLIFGILAWTLLPLMGMALMSLNFMNFVAFPLAGAVIASVCARMALKKIRVSEGALHGAGLAKAAQALAYTLYGVVFLLLSFTTLQVFLHTH